jgi:hypothetical protein
MLPTLEEQRHGENVLWMTVLLKNWVKIGDNAAEAASTILFGSKEGKFGANLRNNGTLMSHENGKLVIRYGKESTKLRITCNALVNFVETGVFYSFPFYYSKLTATLEMEGLESGNKFSVGAPDTDDENVRFTNILSIKQTMFTDNVIEGTQRLRVHFDHDEKTADGLVYYPKIQISFIRGRDWMTSLLKFYLPYTTFYFVAIISIVTDVDFSTFLQIIVGLLVALVMSGSTMIDVENNASLLVLNTASLMFVLTIIPVSRGFSLVFPALVYIWQAFSAWKAFKWLKSQKLSDESKFISIDKDKQDKKNASYFRSTSFRPRPAPSTSVPTRTGATTRLVDFHDLEEEKTSVSEEEKKE